MHRSRLEQYLDQLEQPLAALSAEARGEWREEARQHLLCLIAAHEELGSSPEEAMAAALRQFGDPDRIGQSLRTATRRRADAQSAAEAFRALAAMFWNVGMFGALMRLPGAFDHLAAIGMALGVVYWGAGAALGRWMKHLSPRAAALISFWAGTYTAVPYLFLLGLFYSGLPSFSAAHVGAVAGAATSTGGLLLGTLSAYRARRARGQASDRALPPSATR